MCVVGGTDNIRGNLLFDTRVCDGWIWETWAFVGVPSGWVGGGVVIS